MLTFNEVTEVTKFGRRMYRSNSKYIVGLIYDKRV